MIIKSFKLFESNEFKEVLTDFEKSDDILDLFDDFYDFLIDIDICHFKNVPHVGLFSANKTIVNQISLERIFPNINYNIGFRIKIRFGNEEEVVENLDLTSNLKRIVKMLSLKYHFIGYESSLDEMIFKSGDNIDDIIIRSNEMLNQGWGKGRPDRPINIIDLLFSEDKEITYSQNDIAKYYGWTNYEIDEKGIIFFVWDYSDIVNFMILEKKSNKTFISILSGDYCDSCYYSSYYNSKIEDITYLFSPELESKIVDFINKNYPEIEISQKNKMNKYWDSEFIKALKNLREIEIEDRKTEIIQLIIEITSEYESSAHESKNIQEIETQFQNIIDKNFKNEIFYDNKSMKKIKIFFSNDWIEDQNIFSEKLEDIFIESMYDNKVDFNPILSDYGIVNTEELNDELLRLFID